jgi:hypothetical protein
MGSRDLNPRLGHPLADAGSARRGITSLKFADAGEMVSRWGLTTNPVARSMKTRFVKRCSALKP